MKKVILSLLWILFVIHSALIAGTIPVQQASLAAKNLLWSANQAMGDYSSYIPVLLSTRSEAGESIYYIFRFENKTGFAIISAEDRTLPIIAYSLEGNFPATQEDIPPQMTGLLDYIKDQVLYIKSTTQLQDNEAKESWDKLLVMDSTLSDNPSTIYGPLLTSTWNQNCYYNNSCPTTNSPHPSGPCNHVLTGCVATAMAQIMNYWKFPAHGSGSNSYTDPANTGDPSYGTISSTFNYQYLWDNMPDNLTSNNGSVARLIYDCGVSVDMDYSATSVGSSSFTSDVPSALSTYFFYNSSATFYDKSSFTTSQWNGMLELEILTNRPVQYRGDGSNGGHSWVLDGYNDNGAQVTYHMNWGWSGGGPNGYFSLSNLTNSNGNFTSNQGAVFYIQPLGVNLAAIIGSGLSTSGSNISMTANMMNNSLAPTRDCHVGFYLSLNTNLSTTDYLIGTEVVPSLNSLETNSESHTTNLDQIIPAIPPGLYYAGYYVDNQFQVPETSETDNNYYFTNQVSVNCHPSPLITATKGTYYDYVGVSWAIPSYSNYHKVYRNTTNSTSGAVAVTGWQANNGYYDYDVVPGVNYYYWVKSATTVTGSFASGFSDSDWGSISVQEITSGQLNTPATSPKYYEFLNTNNYWNVVGIKPTVSSEDWDITLYTNPNFTSSLVGSTYGVGQVDFVVIDGNHAPTTYRGIKVNQYSGTGSATVEYKGGTGTLIAGNNPGLSWPIGDLINIKDVYLNPGVYSVSLTYQSGSANLDMALYSSVSGSYYQSRASAIAYSSNIGTNPESMTVTITQADYYGFVVWNNTFSSGTYTVNFDQDGTWQGTVSTNWHTPGNWKNGFIPNQYTNVIIPSAVPHYPLISADSARCFNCTLATGASLTLGAKKLRVWGTLYNGGYINQSNTLSDIYVHGSVACQTGSTASSTGNATYWVSGNWSFESGSNVQLNGGYVEFIGTGLSNIYSNSSNSHFYYLNNFKQDPGSLQISSFSSADLHIYANFYNLGNCKLISNSNYNVNFHSGFQNLNGIFQFNAGTLTFSGNPSAYTFKPRTDCYVNNLTINSTGYTFTLGNTYADTLHINGNLIISGGTLVPSSLVLTIAKDWTNSIGSTGFTEGTGKVIFDGGNYDQICSTETFYSLLVDKPLGGHFKINGGIVVCNSYDWVAGALHVQTGSFTANTLADNAIAGNYYLYSGGTINLHNPTGWIDLRGSLYIYGGNFNVYGGTTMSYWPYNANAYIGMSGGVLDFKDQGININTTPSYTLGTNITGGTIRTVGNVYGQRSDFHPFYGTFEFYGLNDAVITATTGFAFDNLTVNKGAASDFAGDMPSIYLNKLKNDDSPPNPFNPLTNGLTAQNILHLNGDFTINSGVFAFTDSLYVGGSWTNNVGSAGFTEGDGIVQFSGPNTAYFNTNETFFDLSITKGGNGVSDTIFLQDNKTIHVLHDLHTWWGRFKLKSNSTLDIDRNVQIHALSSMSAVTGNSGINLYVGGDWSSTWISIINPLNDFYPDGTTVTFDGAENQNISRLISFVAFNNLVINKTGGNLIVRNSLHISGNLDVLSGGWSNYYTNMNHYISGNITIGSGGNWIGSSNPCTLNLMGTANTTINFAGSGYLSNIVVNKTPLAFDNSSPNPESEESANVDMIPGSSDASVTLLSDIISQNGEVDLIEGSLNLNGHILGVNQGLNILTFQATLEVNAGSTLEIGFDSLNVVAGNLNVIGTATNNATITHLSSGYYPIKINNGTLRARNSIFEFMNSDGISIGASATIDPLNSFDSCTFRNGQNGGTLITNNNCQVISTIGAQFPGNTWSGANNVSKLSNCGSMTFYAYSGGFAGEAYESDPYGLVNWAGGSMLTGTVKYDNSLFSPLSAVNVALKQGAVTISSTTTTSNGAYTFLSVPSGTYTLKCTSTTSWGGVNSTDALLIMKHFTGIIFLSGVKLKSADVNGTNSVNSLDALLTAQRFTALVNSFPAGDWAFEVPNIVSPGTGTLVQNIKGVCYGDVNGSYIPPYKTGTSVELNTDGTLYGDINQIIEVPVSIKNAAEVGALSLILSYPQDDLEILSVRTKYYSDHLVYNANNGELRISWFAGQPLNFNENEALVYLSVRLKSRELIEIHALAGSELADYDALTIPDCKLLYPKIMQSNQQDGIWVLQNAPNPFSGQSTITYYLDEPAQVNISLLNGMGELIRILNNNTEDSGQHSLQIDSKGLSTGMYGCEFKILKASGSFEKIIKMMIIR